MRASCLENVVLPQQLVPITISRRRRPFIYDELWSKASANRPAPLRAAISATSLATAGLSPGLAPGVGR